MIPLRTPVLLRNGSIALVAGGVAAWQSGGRLSWPFATLLALWFSLGGHFVERFFLDWLRQRIPQGRAVQIAARLATWFSGGAVLSLGMALTATPLGRQAPPLRPWAWGLAFIALELVVHGALALARRPNFYAATG